MSTIEEKLSNLPTLSLLGGYTAAELWPLTNLCLLTWVLVFFAPRWSHTPTLTVIAPVVLALIYTLVLANMIMLTKEGEEVPDMMTFEGVVTLFQDPTGAFGGWLHYCVYDPLVGRWMALDSVQRGASTKFHIFVMIPVLMVGMFLPPTGWFLYMVIVRPFLLVPSSSTSSSTKSSDDDEKTKIY
jgi:hypothetical protein